MEHLGIFCSASGAINQEYFDATHELGKWIGKKQKTLVYGGSNLGLMEHIAQTVKINGGHVIGVIPSKLEKSGKESTIPDEIIHTCNLSDRKDIMIEKSDVLIALPGGIGTLDEVFHVMAAAMLGYHNKKIILYNIEGFYNDLVKIFNRLTEEKFARLDISCLYQVANSLDELIKILETL